MLVKISTGSDGHKMYGTMSVSFALIRYTLQPETESTAEKYLFL